MIQTYIYAGIGLVIGFSAAWIVHILQLSKVKRAQKSLQGFLETERLIKERFQKDNSWLHEIKESAQAEYEQKIQALNRVIATMDEDILLLQKSNEETEELLRATNPMVHSLKIKLIEAHNTIARYKAQVAVK